MREHPGKTAEWEPDNNLVVLQAPDLDDIAYRLEARGLAITLFYEPDLNEMLTAICAEPAAGRWLSSLPLAR